MKFAWWPHTTNRSVASYRLRCLQIIQHMNKLGVEAGLYRSSDPPDVLVLSKRYDAKSLKHAQALRLKHGTRLVLDLCDNHFFAESGSSSWKQRVENLREAARSVDRVVACSTALAEVVHAEVKGKVRVSVIEDAAEPPFTPSPSSRMLHPLAEFQLARFCSWMDGLQVLPGRRLVWFGNHGNDYSDGGMAGLNAIQGKLQDAHRDSPTSLTIISNNRRKFHEIFRSWSMPVRYLAWHPQTFSRVLAMHDTALIPIARNPFTICKTNNRAATAFLHGLAVIADTIPSYEPLGDCIVLDDWDCGLQNLLRDPQYRRACALHGQERIKTGWSLERVVRQWQDTLSN